MQSITSTPVRVPSFVRKALGELQYGGVMARFGQFFISEIDFKLERVVNEIEDRDTAGVYAEAKIVIRKSKARIRQTEAEDKEIPSTISAEGIGKLLVERPYAIMREFVFLPYEYEEFGRGNAIGWEALELVRLFTCAIWVLLKDEEVREKAPRPEELEGLESVLKFWSWDRRYDGLQKPLLMRTTIEGENWGVESRKRFFPTGEVRLEGKWKVLGECYINRYRAGQKKRSGEEREEMNKCVEKLFEGMQCLPRGNQREPWVGGKNREVVLNVNPNEYRREALGVEGGVKKRGVKGVMKTAKDAQRDAIGLIIGAGVGEYERKVIEGQVRKRMSGKGKTGENVKKGGKQKKDKKGEGKEEELGDEEGDEDEDEELKGESSGSSVGEVEDRDGELTDGRGVRGSSDDEESEKDEGESVASEKNENEERIVKVRRISSGEDEEDKKGKVTRGRGHGRGRGRGTRGRGRPRGRK
ncbi:hypothetical protein GGU11DRAFT_751383 [Lentinula aff. detonsa]|nr:hypothetical protein GGU11DRAFT_751383 [Lentinula aff. detonsa]